MKTIRNYRFVLTVLDNEQLNAGECRIANDEVSGERMFASECHYYAEANNYRQECQRGWMSHCDYVYLWTGSERINLTRMPESKRIAQTV